MRGRDCMGARECRMHGGERESEDCRDFSVHCNAEKKQESRKSVLVGISFSLVSQKSIGTGQYDWCLVWYEIEGRLVPTYMPIW